MVEETFPVLKTMTRRQLELLHLKGISLPDQVFRVVDLSQNLNFASVTTDKMPCVTPDGAKFLTRRVRFMNGIEALRFMGIFFADEDRLNNAYSSAFLQDLAGNAYETSSCAANLVSSMVFLAHNWICKRKGFFLQGQMLTNKDDDHDDDDDENFGFTPLASVQWQ